MFKKDLDGILNSFSATLTKLKTFVEDKEVEALAHLDTFHEAQKAHIETIAAKSRAEKIIQNLEKLLEAA